MGIILYIYRLWDNLYDEMIINIISERYIGKIDLDVNLCAEQIAKQANIYSLKR